MRALRGCIKSPVRRHRQCLILIAIACSCLSLLAVHTLFDPFATTANRVNDEAQDLKQPLAVNEFPEQWLARRGMLKKFTGVIDYEVKVHRQRISFIEHDDAVLDENVHNHKLSFEPENLKFNANLAAKPEPPSVRPIRERDLRNAAMVQERGLSNNVIMTNQGVIAPVLAIDLHAQNASRAISRTSYNRTFVDNSRLKRHMFKRKSTEVHPAWKRDLYYNHTSPPSKFIAWTREQEMFCEGKMIAYTHEFALFQNMSVNPKYCTCKLKGGEFIRNVLHQSEDSEYYQYEMGCFQLSSCAVRPKYYFNGNHLNSWMYALSTHGAGGAAESGGVGAKGAGEEVVNQRHGFTMAIMRYEYANLYHTMTDWYNAFALMQFFNESSYTTNILIVDAHPYGNLDSVWTQLFNSTFRLSNRTNSPKKHWALSALLPILFSDNITCWSHFNLNLGPPAEAGIYLNYTAIGAHRNVNQLVGENTKIIVFIVKQQLMYRPMLWGSLSKTTSFSRLVWGIIGYNSPMTTTLSPRPPLYEQFREFFLSGYNTAPDAHQLNCDNISVTFIWRHDYVAHPRNPTGFVSRKIRNEAQLLRAVRKRYPYYLVKGVQIDLLDMRAQLDHIVNTDVLIGMHGAGLTHALFLPKGAALIELAPQYWTSHSEHFMAIADWRGLVYQSWYNNDPTLEGTNHTTTIPPYILLTLLKKAVRKLCVAPNEHANETQDEEAVNQKYNEPNQSNNRTKSQNISLHPQQQSQNEQQQQQQKEQQQEPQQPQQQQELQNNNQTAHPGARPKRRRIRATGLKILAPPHSPPSSPSSSSSGLQRRKVKRAIKKRLKDE